ncbi:hypothetical protein HYC85_025758 [Camellia sinensis]|uniref:Uncharacterized protein n=1 Tax=Camellia sinensis TaxID=4442 RepID=A0A7J7GC18_CAMSI|nr:hypothetical protein HYC85_025758 [Camellia sinensis]
MQSRVSTSRENDYHHHHIDENTVNKLIDYLQRDRAREEKKGLGRQRIEWCM